MDKDTYMKVCYNKPCLTHEIRTCFLGIKDPKCKDQEGSDENEEEFQASFKGKKGIKQEPKPIKN